MNVVRGHGGIGRQAVLRSLSQKWGGSSSLLDRTKKPLRGFFYVVSHIFNSFSRRKNNTPAAMNDTAAKPENNAPAPKSST